MSKIKDKEALFLLKDYPDLQELSEKHTAFKNAKLDQVQEIEKKAKAECNAIVDQVKKEHKAFWAEIETKVAEKGIATKERLEEKSHHSIEEGVYFIRTHECDNDDDDEDMPDFLKALLKKVRASKS